MRNVMRTGIELGVVALRAVPVGLALIIGYPLLVVAVMAVGGYRFALAEGGLLAVFFVAGVAVGMAIVVAVVLWSFAQHFECAWPASRLLHLLILIVGVTAYGFALATLLPDDRPMSEIQPGLPHAAMFAGAFACILSIATWPSREKQDASEFPRTD